MRGLTQESEVIIMENTLIDRIIEAIQSDDEVRSDLSLEIQKEYSKADEMESKAIDRIFIHLTGWSLRTLINGHEDESDAEYNPFDRDSEDVATEKYLRNYYSGK